MNTCGERRLFLHRISLRGFRNYLEEGAEFADGFNLIIGENGQGKTNLLEAIYLLSTTRLLRSSRDNEAIRFGADTAQVDGYGQEPDFSLRILLHRGQAKKAFVNSQAMKRASDVLGRLPSTSISLADLSLSRGDPSDRRLFLDLELSQAYPAYLQALATYRRAVDQRNAILKAAQTSNVPREHFESWECALASSGALMRQYRGKYVERLCPLSGSVLEALSLGEKITLSYENKDGAETEEMLRQELERTRNADIARGSTGIGPHRDDLAIHIDSHDVRRFASQGQQRSAVIAIKMGSMQLTKELLGQTPILLLDDIFAELDEGRRIRFIEWILEQAKQAFLTCTEAAAAGPAIGSIAKTFLIEGGKIQS